MKLKINKACDLNSISVLPPHSRRGNVIPSGTDSVFAKSQGSSQLWSQSQQSFSQGMSMSQLSQNSQEEIVTNENRLVSQDNLSKRISCLAPVAYAREDTQMQVSRSSNNVTHRWNLTSASDHKCRVSEELEHRIGLMETSLNKLGMVLDSVQSDVMQVNRTVKEGALENGIRQKMIVHESSLQLAIKGQEDIKASFDVNLKAITDQLKKQSNYQKLEEIVSSLLSLPDQIETWLLKMQNELCQKITKEMGILSNRMSYLHENHQQPGNLPPKRKDCSTTKSPKRQLFMIKNASAPLKSYSRRSLTPKNEAENPRSLKQKPPSFTDMKHIIELKEEEITITKQRKGCRTIQSPKRQLSTVEQAGAPRKFYIRRKLTPKNEAENPRPLKQKCAAFTDMKHVVELEEEGNTITKQEREWRVIIDSDEEIDGGFSFLLEEKEIGNGNRLMDNAREESNRILRKARRMRKGYIGL